MESVVSIARVEDRTDRRIAEILANQDRPLLIHAESMNPVTLRFKEPDMEAAYHRHFLGGSGGPGDSKTEHKVDAPTYSVAVDILVAAVVYCLVSLVAWVVFGVRFPAWVIYFAISASVLVLFLLYFIVTFWRTRRLIPLVTHWYPRHLVALLLIELPIGAALANLACYSLTASPSAANAVGSSRTGDGIPGSSSPLPPVNSSHHPEAAPAYTQPDQLVVFYIGFALLLAHCNFSQISHWMKSGFALVLGVTLVLLVCVGECPCHIVSEGIAANSFKAASAVASGKGADAARGAAPSSSKSFTRKPEPPVSGDQLFAPTPANSSSGGGPDLQGTISSPPPFGQGTTPIRASSTASPALPARPRDTASNGGAARGNGKHIHSDEALSKLKFFHGQCLFRWESILDVILALLLVAFLNRQFESIFRMSFYGDIQAVKDTEKMQGTKDQADWLLNNIIPNFVLDKLKANLKYSENKDMVGVMFASIINWNQFYEESYKGGREFLRVLNEIVSDFDALLDEPQFNQIEKIKTIGSTYMAASGLNAETLATASSPDEHLIQLMDFALAIQEKLARFNEDMLSFEFIMKIGYNIGPVTAGVIGTTKLYYDIWGDTVNIASRMYSTGVPRRIQVSDRSIGKLSGHFEFEFRDHIDVKGIEAGMDVYLLVTRRSTPIEAVPAPGLAVAGAAVAPPSPDLPIEQSPAPAAVEERQGADSGDEDDVAPLQQTEALSP